MTIKEKVKMTRLYILTGLMFMSSVAVLFELVHVI